MVQRLIRASGITGSLLRAQSGERLFGSDEAQFAQVGTFPLELVPTPPADLAGKIDATAAVLPDIEILAEDRLEVGGQMYRVQTVTPENLFGIVDASASGTGTAPWALNGSVIGIKRKRSWPAIQGARLTLAIRQATIKNALLLVREIKRGIVKQAPGGVPFVQLAESTIERKGSSKALIDTGFLLSAITQKIMAEEAFVGLLRGTVNKDGEQMVNIGAIMEYGATIQASQRRDHHPAGPALPASGDGSLPGTGD